MKTTGFYPRARVDVSGTGIMSSAGGLLLVDAVRAVGLDRALSQSWRRGGNRSRSMIRPRLSVISRSVSHSVGTVWLTSPRSAASRACNGPVASDPTVSRLIDTLAADAGRAFAAIDPARA
ncbi:hypothetical protein G1H11_01600 [Phytoactinopolyspora alkaliphila]|uniref:Transposase DDE domain-containing protein n=1 Tax=Phytoactinopolyspora alkaliphila TaxID=1783498 RepID=A0A6N9YG69_9ACTN|nr:hypothetical protein [Phytoactinopolyspora alkaliphila]